MEIAHSDLETKRKAQSENIKTKLKVEEQHS